MSKPMLEQINGFQRNLGDPAGVSGSERRRSPRTVLADLAYIHLEPDSGAIVLNISEEGLGFHAVAPVNQSGVIRFWFSMRPDERVQASGEVVWTDESKKTGGLRFTSLSEGAREQIQKWMGQGAATSTPSAAKSPAPQEAAFEYLPKLDSTPPAMPWDVRQERPEDAPESARAYFDLTASQMDVETHSGTRTIPSLFWQAPPPERPLRRSQPRFIRGFAAGVMVSLAVAAAFLGYNYRGRVGSLLTTASQSGIKSAPPAQPLPNVPPPVSTAAGAAQATAPNTPTNTTPSTTTPNTTVPDTSTTAPPPSSPAPANSESPAITNPSGVVRQAGGQGPQASVALPPHSVEQIPSEDNDSEPDMIAAEQYLHGPDGRKNTAAAIGFLWAAIEKGNSSALIILADLYARGDGVPKNCAQARVLLIAAAGKGNLEARQRLQELNGKGCF
jgi:TPR repeat protein